MTRQIDHVAEAMELFNSEFGAMPNSLGYETADVQHLLNMLGAQVHATLALVEQQRITNRLAVALTDQLTLIAEDQTDQPPANVAVRIRDYLSESDWASIDVEEADDVD